jgi:ribosomal protein S18 acetylase RimI-like enzyme
MDFEIVPADKLPLAEQAAIFNQAFAGYLAGSIELNLPGFSRFLCAQGADLCYSRFVQAKDGTQLAFGYINRTGNIPRLAAMGTIPAARRTGAAAHLLSHLLMEAKERSDEAMVLEVFEQNLPAVSLYRQHGFRELTRLFGWRRQGDGTARDPNRLREISPLATAQMPSALEYPILPWQISRYAVAKLEMAHAFCLNDACVVIGSIETQPIRLHGFFGYDGQNWEGLRDVIAAVLGRFPEKEFFAPAIFPERFGAGIFEPLGFVREPLNQFLMRRDL